MQNSPFKDKIQKQHQIIIKQLSKFRNYWQGKLLPTDKIQTYCNLVTYLSNLHTAYVNNCMEYFTPSIKQETMDINRSLIDDIVNKLRHFQSPFTTNESYVKPTRKQAKQTCHVCATKIREIDVRMIKQQLVDQASLRKGLLKKMYTDLQNQNSLLFSKDEDQVFFKFLNTILVKKQEVLAMQTQQINDFLIGITKSFSDLNFLTQYTPVKLNPAQYKQNYKEDMEKTIVDSLKLGFNGKVHPWVSKVFQTMKKYILRQKKLNFVDQFMQTSQTQVDYGKKRSQYAANSQSRKQLDQLKQQVQQSLLTIDQLKASISVLVKQKKQLQEYYMKEMNQLMVGKMNLQQQLKRTQSDFSNLKTLKNTQIFQLNKKLSKQKKKTQPNSLSTTQNNKKDQQVHTKQSQLQNLERNHKKHIQQVNKQQEHDKQIRKKKPNLNRLFSKQSDVEHVLLNQNPNSTTVDLGTINESNNNKFKNSTYDHYQLQGNSLTYPNSTLQQNTYSPQETDNSTRIADEFLKQIQLRSIKRKSKPNQKQSFKHQQPQQHTPRVQFRLNPNDTIQIIPQQPHQQYMNLSVNGSAPKMSKKKLTTKKIKPQNTQKKNKRTNKRMLSIQMKMPPLMKASQSIYKPKLQQVKFSQVNEMNSPMTRGGISSRKKVFEYVPLQNRQEYESLKEKVNEITSRIQLRNTEKIKHSVNYIKNEGSSGDVSKLYGFSIFSKKFSEVVKQGNSQHSKDKQNNKSKQADNQKLSKSRSKDKSLHYGKTIRKQEVQHNDYSQQTQGATQNQQDLHPSVIDHIPVQQRKQLYNTMSKQSLIPSTLNFHHYEMIVRKLFAEQKSQLFNQVNTKLAKSRLSTVNMNDDLLGKKKQKQSVKINIDAKFFQQVNSFRTHNSNLAPHHNSINGKLLLNLPKLHHSPSLLSTSQNTTLQNSPLFNPNIIQVHKQKKSLFHTLRQNKTQLRDDSLAHARHSYVQNQIHESSVGDNEATKNNNQTPSISTNITQKPAQHQSTLLQLLNSKLINIFSPNDLKLLFESQLSAYQYEQSTKTPFHSHQQQVSPTKTYQLTLEDYDLAKSLYSVLAQIKQKNSQIYYKVCSFVKSPYQSVRSGFDFINTAKNLPIDAWTMYLAKIYSLKRQQIPKSFSNKENSMISHKSNTQHNSNLSFSSFLKPFELKLVQLLILANK